MISIIICSRKAQIEDSLFDNITKTIKFEHEIIAIDNSANKYSIFEAYNQGIKKSKGKYLCFIHDDIRFHTQNWGNVIETIFQSNEEIGLIGIAGSKIKTKMPAAWWDCPEQDRVVNIIQHLKDGKIEKWHYGWNDNVVEEVAAIDGVFMAVPRSNKPVFSEKLNGFHNYDLDISFKMKLKNKKVVVTNQLLLEHFSEGELNGEWIESTLKLHRLYRKILPINVNQTIDKNTFKSIEIDNAHKMIYLSFLYKRPFLALQIWFKLFLIDRKNKYHSIFWKEFLNLN